MHKKEEKSTAHESKRSLLRQNPTPRTELELVFETQWVSQEQGQTQQMAIHCHDHDVVFSRLEVEVEFCIDRASTVQYLQVLSSKREDQKTHQNASYIIWAQEISPCLKGNGIYLLPRSHGRRLGVWSNRVTDQHGLFHIYSNSHGLFILCVAGVGGKVHRVHTHI